MPPTPFKCRVVLAAVVVVVVVAVLVVVVWVLLRVKEIIWMRSEMFII